MILSGACQQLRSGEMQFGGLLYLNNCHVLVSKNETYVTSNLTWKRSSASIDAITKLMIFRLCMT